MADEKFNLSRRKTLAAVGTIGAASAGAGFGTSAFFSDQETFENNQLQAGELDLSVRYEVYEYQAGANADNRNFGPGTINGDNTVHQELDDVKPGDYGYSKFCFNIVDNPGYVWAGGELTDNDENSVTEPEADASEENNSQDLDGDISGDGELAQAIDVTVFYCDSGDTFPEGTGESGRPSNVSIDDVVAEGSLAEVLAQLQAGLPLDSGRTDPDTEAFAGSSESGDYSGRCLCFAWELPKSVGNVVQSDSVEFDLSFTAMQSRHNDGAANPYADETFTAPYINDSDNATQIEGTLRLDISYGADNIVYRVQMDDDDSGAKMSDPLNSSTNFWVPFDTDDDGTMNFQLQWYPGAGAPDDPFGYKQHSGGWGSVQGLPSGVTAVWSGETVVFSVPKSMIGSSGSSYRVGVHMSAGGEGPYAAISTDNTNIVPSGNFSSSDNLKTTTVQ